MKESLLELLIQKTPSMQCVDGVKLLYQHHFGCGHLLASREMVARRIEEEIRNTEQWEEAEAAEFIGGGLCRLNLHHPLVRLLPPERIASMMLITQQIHAENPRNSQEAFLEGLDQLMSLSRQGKTPFTPSQLEEYLKQYAVAGYPMVSHSDAYRQEYQPAYRVVLSDFAALLPVILAMEKKLFENGSALAVLDGPCGSGKSTLAAMLSRLYDDAPVIPMDDFFLPPELRTPQRLEQPGGNIHYERFLAQIMPFIGSVQAFVYDRFDCSTFALTQRHVSGGKVRIVEGSYSMHPLFREGWKKANAVTAYLQVEDEVQLRRIAKRNPEMLDIFKKRWIPLEKKYAEAYYSKCWAEFCLTSISWEAGK